MFRKKRENEAFVLTHLGAGVDHVQYVEPLRARKIEPDKNCALRGREQRVKSVGIRAVDKRMWRKVLAP